MILNGFQCFWFVSSVQKLKTRICNQHKFSNSVITVYSLTIFNVVIQLLNIVRNTVKEILFTGESKPAIKFVSSISSPSSQMIHLGTLWYNDKQRYDQLISKQTIVRNNALLIISKMFSISLKTYFFSHHLEACWEHLVCDIFFANELFWHYFAMRFEHHFDCKGLMQREPFPLIIAKKGLSAVPRKLSLHMMGN